MRDPDMTLPEIPIYERQDTGLLGHALQGADRAETVMQTVIAGLGFAGKALGPILPMADRIADRRLVAMNDPYRSEILSIRDKLGKAGPIAFNLSYEFGCTARVFYPDQAPVLFRTLDCRFVDLVGWLKSSSYAVLQGIGSRRPGRGLLGACMARHLVGLRLP